MHNDLIDFKGFHSTQKFDSRENVPPSKGACRLYERTITSLNRMRLSMPVSVRINRRVIAPRSNRCFNYSHKRAKIKEKKKQKRTRSSVPYNTVGIELRFCFRVNRVSRV